MEWYWYITGAATVLFVQSVLLNIALANGWVKILRDNRKMNLVRIYDQDDSKGLRRAN